MYVFVQGVDVHVHVHVHVHVDVDENEKLVCVLCGCVGMFLHGLCAWLCGHACVCAMGLCAAAIILSSCILCLMVIVACALPSRCQARRLFNLSRLLAHLLLKHSLSLAVFKVGVCAHLRR